MNRKVWKDQEAYNVVFNHCVNCTCQEGKFLVRSALDHIYQAIKRNESKVIVKHFIDNSRDYYCGNCDNYITSGRLGNIRHDAKVNVFCRHCGQKLDWEEKQDE